MHDFVKSFALTCRLHTTKNISPSPTLQFGGVFCIDVDQGSLINKNNWKIALACLFFVVDALLNIIQLILCSLQSCFNKLDSLLKTSNMLI